MTERPTFTEVTDIPTAEEVQAALEKHDLLAQSFSATNPADWYKDEISLEQKYGDVIEIRSDRHTLYIKHTPSSMYVSFPTMMGPRALKYAIKNIIT